ncbi:uncharacterized protein DUF4360 [Actinomadura pelletieri DSM 43383]|uniref:Uncharacterized protein DUF4360 n=1 Tax=Actinomadura pelletieri DSM 43383 TaxID=1120940 RepID=A0A495QYK2_9ACTN|nr:DUF4360 domain-containing protein [Actinomadura pelletieri]RKS79104.1 uncharacterized protein DUF4360 [Actinomadura pelletieri DSM 43383]
MRKGLAVFAAVVVGAAATVVPAVPAMAWPPGTWLEVVRANGSGCSAGTVRAFFAEDTGNQMEVEYSGFTARAGGDSKPHESRSDCQVALMMHMPERYTYGISATYHRGYAHLQEGADATVKTVHAFEGAPDAFTRTVKGPFDSIWTLYHHPPSPRLITWKPCDKDLLYINSELRVDAGTSDPSELSDIAMDTGSGAYDHSYILIWRDCS